MTKDNVTPGEKWSFDADVTSAFDDMLERSIPQYEVMRKAVYDLAIMFRKVDTDIVDLGCSRGESIAPLIDKFGSTNRYTLVEVSPPMLEVSRQRFRGYIDTGIVRLLPDDLRISYPLVTSSVTLCILTLQFTPIEYRQRIIRDIYKSTISGGALILVEKLLGANALIDKIMVDNYYRLKSENGYSQDQIERKRLSLEGVLVPITEAWNIDLLKSSGFRQVDCFWRWMNFAGFLAIRD